MLYNISENQSKILRIANTVEGTFFEKWVRAFFFFLVFSKPLQNGSTHGFEGGLVGKVV